MRSPADQNARYGLPSNATIADRCAARKAKWAADKITAPARMAAEDAERAANAAWVKANPLSFVRCP